MMRLIITRGSWCCFPIRPGYCSGLWWLLLWIILLCFLGLNCCWSFEYCAVVSVPIPRAIGSTFVTLIPKIYKWAVGNFHPISLCNILNKFFTKNLIYTFENFLATYYFGEAVNFSSWARYYWQCHVSLGIDSIHWSPYKRSQYDI